MNALPAIETLVYLVFVSRHWGVQLSSYAYNGGKKLTMMILSLRVCSTNRLLVFHLIALSCDYCIIEDVLSAVEKFMSFIVRHEAGKLTAKGVLSS